MFKKIRILILLLILFFVALETALTRMRTTDWDQPLWVVIYPINGDESTMAADFINALQEQDFDDIEEFFSREAKRFDPMIDDPVTVKLAATVAAQPPMPVKNGNMLEVIVWSLKLRYWSWQNDNYDGPTPDIQMFVRYFDPNKNPRLGHSLGLKKGMVGVVNAFAKNKMVGSNNVIIAHELLHTVGATDKYDLATNQPLYPAGFADPQLQPLYPQRKAELMGGRIPLSESKSVIPKSLKRVAVGEVTAIEIGWVR